MEVGSKVLCRHALSSSADSIIPLWHPGVVDAILHADEVVSVQCTPCSSVVECALDKIVPLPSESQSLQLSPSNAIPIEPGNSSTSFEKGDLLSETFTDDEPPSEWLLNPTAVSALGEWEKHTKGIGSRLMSLMGYVAGAGLGRRQEGRVEPVPAYLYPPGVSLDRCMELREKSGGEDLLQVEKRLKKDQLREEKRIKREEERISANTSVFDIINNQLAGPGAKKDRMKASKDSVNVDKSHLKTNSSKELNLKGYQLGQRSAQLEREIVHLSQSMARQAPRDKEAAGSIQKRIDEKKQELELTNRAQARVSSEQNSRREKKKYDIF
ncbi:hypothetical protein HAZT_HAZT009646 [Hyalella azteca]|uniref:G-patch domain-containing protein n=1 Tax=Hyalella azteca TaxID=294128 RepID=A0A6A0HCB3_HYAAZ|nr:hypothetical protein HAZT_HAZT009646 [Hyalella azteca]